MSGAVGEAREIVVGLDRGPEVVDTNGKMIWSLTGYQETGMISAIYPFN